MPVLFNTSSGLAEDLPDQEAQAALAQGSHEVPLVDRQGNPGSAPFDEAARLVNEQGFSQPNDEQLSGLLKYAKHSTPAEQLKTAAEGAAESATFGASAGLENALFNNAPERAMRQEANPYSHMAGQVGGLLGPAVAAPELGALKALNVAGEAAAGALGLAAPVSTLAKVGSAAVKGAVETAMLSGGDEVTKYFNGDPDQTAGNVASSMLLNGLAGGVFGAGLGSVSPLWEKASGSSVGKYLSAIKNKTEGLGHETLPSPELNVAAAKVGHELDPIMNAALSNNEVARKSYQELIESATPAGDATRAAQSDFTKGMADAAANELGHTAESAASLSDKLSAFDTGQKAADSLAEAYQSKQSPLSKQFEDLKAKYENAPVIADALQPDGTVAQGTISKISQGLQDLATKEGWGLSPSSDVMKELTRVQKELPNIKTAKDLTTYMTRISENTASSNPFGADPLSRAGSLMRSVLSENADELAMNHLGAEAPALVNEFQYARAAYKQQAQLRDYLADNLGVKGSVNSFGRDLKAMAADNPEKVINRLSGKGNAAMLDFLQTNYPETADIIRKWHTDQLVKAAADKAVEGYALNTTTLFNKIRAMTPELKNFVFPPEKLSNLQGIESLLSKIPQRIGPSGTPRTLDALWAKVPSGIGSVVGFLQNHSIGGAASGHILGQVANYVGRALPDHIKLATLKYLGSDLPMNPGAFKSMAEFISHTYRGNELIKNGIKNIFNAAKPVLPTSVVPSQSDRDSLKKKVMTVKTNPQAMLDVGGQTGYYLPQHQTAVAATAARGMSYLNQIKPNTDAPGPLDDQREPSQMEKVAYDRQVDIANQPLLALQHIKDGSLIPQDVQTVQTVYPALYAKMKNELIQNVIDLKAKNHPISYGTKMAISQFLGQPLDPTLSPMSMQSIQSIGGVQAAQPSIKQMLPQKKISGKAASGLQRLAKSTATPNQSREMNRKA